MSAKHAWKVELIPWDYKSTEHVTRWYEQRVACGWRAEEVPENVEKAKKGDRMFYWVVCFLLLLRTSWRPTQEAV
jgi:hypothetical protein